MKSLPIYQVDAFASNLFKGNPAAVCPLDKWLSDETMQAIAAENNLSETAFFVREDEGYRLRWFTPMKKWHYVGMLLLPALMYFLINWDFLEKKFYFIA
ncbi:PhzF family phenazine biosynthesis protein [Legionella pneumophila]|nr:PhzF family phenazine biosynthesis protein [Legionella pneumophila]